MMPTNMADEFDEKAHTIRMLELEIQEIELTNQLVQMKKGPCDRSHEDKIEAMNNLIVNKDLESQELRSVIDDLMHIKAFQSRNGLI